MTEFTIGVDISKSTLDVFRLEDGTLNQFANSPVGFKALIKWLGDLPIKRIVFEPTRSYHRAFEKTFGGSFPMVKVNPLQARRFAHGLQANRERATCHPRVVRHGSSERTAGAAPFGLRSASKDCS